MSAFASLSHLGPLPIWDGVLSRAVQGEHITLAVVELAPGCEVPEHQHPNEQLGLVIQGSMTFEIGGERRQLAAGDTYNIPANVLHRVTAGPNGGVAVDCFSPVRADWVRFTALPPARPAWP
jgi:quercetin dioxygenase-like cupin family protein